MTYTSYHHTQIHTFNSKIELMYIVRVQCIIFELNHFKVQSIDHPVSIDFSMKITYVSSFRFGTGLYLKLICFAHPSKMEKTKQKKNTSFLSFQSSKMITQWHNQITNVPDIDDISKQLLRVLVVFNGDEWLNVAAAVVAIVLA